MLRGATCRLLFLSALVLMLVVTSAGPAGGLKGVPGWNSSVAGSLPSDIVNADGELDALFSQVDTERLTGMVRNISEDHGYRVWYPLDKAPSGPLEEAWDYVNDSMISATAGHLCFENRTEYSSLVCRLAGSRPNLAPIVIGGVISSAYSPGANGYAASVAAVLESARILNTANITNDVLFVLVNTVPSFGYGDYGNVGFRALVTQLMGERNTPAAVFWFSSLLYESDETQGNRVAMTTVHHSTQFGPTHLITNLAAKVSRNSGGNLLSTVGAYSGFWTRSGAFESSQSGIPSFVLSQVYSDGLSGSSYDVWDDAHYSYSQLTEAVGLAVCMTWILGNMGSGSRMEYQGFLPVTTGSSQIVTVPATGECNATVAIEWSIDQQLNLSLLSPGGYPLALTSGNSTLTIEYRVVVAGLYSLAVFNPGPVDVIVTYRFQVPQDYDLDTLNDDLEAAFGSDSISRDTDRDKLSDDLEYSMGTDPQNEDSDSDGAWDGVELQYGSDPLITDSDNDTLSDGYEIANGLSPTSTDTDSDGLLDNIEVDIGTDPLSPDSDLDGLTDSIEILNGCDPLNEDSDSDGLNDLFEVLNGLDPKTNDSDADGLSDLYEIEHGLDPVSPDSDHDGLPDAADWAPTEHWITASPAAALSGALIALAGWLVQKKRSYDRGVV